MLGKNFFFIECLTLFGPSDLCGKVVPRFVFSLILWGCSFQSYRYDCVVHWAKLEKPRAAREAEDTRARVRRRCVMSYERNGERIFRCVSMLHLISFWEQTVFSRTPTQ